MVVAVVALSFALVGSAVAGTESLKRAVTKSKVKSIAKKQANKVLNKRAGEFLAANAVRAEGNASSVDIDNFTTATYADALSETFNAPSAGFALISSAVGAADDTSIAGNGALYTRIAVDGTPTTADDFKSPAQYIAADSGGTGTNTVVVPVTAGNHTATVQIRSGGTGAYIFSRQITVLFVPNGDATPVPYSGGKDGGGANGQG
jgi:hypothetical protein